MNNLQTALLEIDLLCLQASNCSYTDISVTFIYNTNSSYQNRTIDSYLFIICLKLLTVAQYILQGMVGRLVKNELEADEVLP
jgi:hypothetical protein